ncbi:iron-sulfur cluster assembly accessory protein [Saprospiraceae bacterium]
MYVSFYNKNSFYIMSELNETTTTPVTITQSAIKQLEVIRREQNIPEDQGLRIGVKGGGCSGFSYMIGFDHKQDSDQEFIINGMKVFMDKLHGIYLLGMEIDWDEGLNNRGFTFKNPNAKTTCGCGTSFSA